MVATRFLRDGRGKPPDGGPLSVALVTILPPAYHTYEKASTSLSYNCQHAIPRGGQKLTLSAVREGASGDAVAGKEDFSRPQMCRAHSKNAGPGAGRPGAGR